MSAAFDGATYNHDLDFTRLNRQSRAVAVVMADGHWHTLAGLAAMVHASEASVSARLRDLRKPKFGSFNIQRRRDQYRPGVWLYRLDGTMPAQAVAPARPSRAELERRLTAIETVAGDALAAGAHHLRASTVRAMARGEA